MVASVVPAGCATATFTVFAVLTALKKASAGSCPTPGFVLCFHDPSLVLPHDLHVILIGPLCRQPPEQSHSPVPGRGPFCCRGAAGGQFPWREVKTRNCRATQRRQSSVLASREPTSGSHGHLPAIRLPRRRRPRSNNQATQHVSTFDAGRAKQVSLDVIGQRTSWREGE